MPMPLEMTRWIDARASDARIGRDAGAPNLMPLRRAYFFLGGALLRSSSGKWHAATWPG